MGSGLGPAACFLSKARSLRLERLRSAVSAAVVVIDDTITSGAASTAAAAAAAAGAVKGLLPSCTSVVVSIVM